MALQVDDIILARVLCRGHNQVSQNHYHYKIGANPDNLDEQDLAHLLTGMWSATYRAILPSGPFSFYGVGVTKLPVSENDESGSKLDSVGTHSSTVSFPGIVSGLVTLNTVGIGRSDRGRRYLPFIPAGSCQANGEPTVAYLALLDAIFNVYLAGETICDGLELIPVLGSGKLITGFTSRNYWGRSHRRRVNSNPDNVPNWPDWIEVDCEGEPGNGDEFDIFTDLEPENMTCTDCENLGASSQVWTYLEGSLGNRVWITQPVSFSCGDYSTAYLRLSEQNGELHLEAWGQLTEGDDELLVSWVDDLGGSWDGEPVELVSPGAPFEECSFQGTVTVRTTPFPNGNGNGWPGDVQMEAEIGDDTCDCSPINEATVLEYQGEVDGLRTWLADIPGFSCGDYIRAETLLTEDTSTGLVTIQFNAYTNGFGDNLANGSTSITSPWDGSLINIDISESESGVCSWPSSVDLSAWSEPED